MAKRLLSLAIVGMLTAQSAMAEVPTQALTFNTNVTVSNATATMEDKIEKAQELIKAVIATDTFRDRVLNHTYNGVKTYVDNGGFTNAQIYQKMLDGAETLNGILDNEMDLDMEMYYENSTTVGYTYPSSTKIWANTKYYNNYTPAQITSNMTHEWLHKLGFKHAVSYSTSRDYSVPYAVGRIMREIAATITLPAPTPTPTPTTTPTSYLTAPTNVAISNTTSNVTLKWGAATSSSGISTYKIYRKLSGSTTSYLQGSTTTLTYTQARPTSNATYYVKAVDKAGKTINSATVSYVKTTAVSNLALTKTTTNVNLTWSAAKSSAVIKEYKVYRRLYGSSTNYLQGSTTSLNFTQVKPSASSAYYYVRAVDTNGESVKSVEVKYTK